MTSDLRLPTNGDYFLYSVDSIAAADGLPDTAGIAGAGEAGDTMQQ